MRDWDEFEKEKESPGPLVSIGQSIALIMTILLFTAGSLGLVALIKFLWQYIKG